MTNYTHSILPRSAAGHEHEYLRSLLPEYAMVCLEGAPVGDEWLPLEAHVTSCAACADELDDLLQLLEDTYVGTLTDDQAVPEVDLAALPPWSLSRPGAEPLLAVSRTLGAAREVVVVFTRVLVDAMQRPNLAGGFRIQGSEDESSAAETSSRSEPLPSEYSYSVRCSPPDHLDIAIDLTLTDTTRALYRIRAIVVDPKAPFAENIYHVTLSYEAQRVDKVTDALGCVVFTDVPYGALAQLQFTIRLGPLDESRDPPPLEGQ